MIDAFPTRPVTMLVTDRRLAGGEGPAALDRLIEIVERAAAAGVSLVQVRERGLDDRSLLSLVQRILRAASGTATRVVVNDRIDIALASGSDGVHLPADGIPPADARRLLSPASLVGRSVHSAREAAEITKSGGCDYLLYGTVFATASKPAGHPVAGPEGLAAACSATGLPVLAIGGISPARFPAIAASGAAGLAAIGLFAGTTSRADVARILEQVREAYAARA